MARIAIENPKGDAQHAIHFIRNHEVELSGIIKTDPAG